ncbi:hypothetical protein [Methylophilus sp.]|uniref:hypothetical protein n=1 Tax=Methylophilus sp. TaxID=29541 RepID=UPI0040356511
MTLNHDAHHCPAHADAFPAESGSPETTRFARRHTNQVGQHAETSNQDAYDPDIIFPAAESVEEDIVSEFYPAIYIP